MRTRGWTTGREHHLFGKAQISYFHILEWASSVIDIREQYPLLPVDSTLDIAKRLGFRHPTHQRNSPGGVITVDFLVTLLRGGFQHQEAHILASTELLEAESREAYRRILEIKKQYFRARNIPVIIRTEKDISEIFARNVYQLRKHRDIFSRVPLSADELALVTHELTSYALSGMPLRDAGKACDARFGLKPGDGLAVVYYLIATKQWKIDLNVPIEPSQPVVFISGLELKKGGNLVNI